MVEPVPPPARRPTYRPLAWFIVGTIASAIVVNLVPDTVPPSSAADFFLAASGVNATILVAIAVTISSIVRTRWGGPTRWRMALFVAQLSIVFIGMIAGGLGILLFNSAVPFDSVKFRFLADLVFLTWILGFMLLAIGIEASVFPSNAPELP